MWRKTDSLTLPLKLIMDSSYMNWSFGSSNFCWMISVQCGASIIGFPWVPSAHTCFYSVKPFQFGYVSFPGSLWDHLFLGRWLWPRCWDCFSRLSLCLLCLNLFALYFTLQARILALNASYFLKAGGHFVISIRVCICFFPMCHLEI